MRMRSQSAYLGLLVLISVVNATSQLLMRWGGSQAAASALPTPTVWHWLWISRWWLTGIMVGWIAGLGWAWCLRRLPLGTAIPMYAGLAYVLSITSGAYLLKERMSAIQVMGAAIILLVSLSSTPASVAHTPH